MALSTDAIWLHVRAHACTHTRTLPQCSFARLVWIDYEYIKSGILVGLYILGPFIQTDVSWKIMAPLVKTRVGGTQSFLSSRQKKRKSTFSLWVLEKLPWKNSLTHSHTWTSVSPSLHYPVSRSRLFSPLFLRVYFPSSFTLSFSSSLPPLLLPSPRVW